MILKIFFDDKSFHELKRSIPSGSRSKRVLEESVRLKFFGSNAVISCNEAEARNLLLYAGHCPRRRLNKESLTLKALLSAGLTVDENPRE
jgi:hypothetical protein